MMVIGTFHIELYLWGLQSTVCTLYIHAHTYTYTLFWTASQLSIMAIHGPVLRLEIAMDAGLLMKVRPKKELCENINVKPFIHSQSQHNLEEERLCVPEIK